MIPDKWLWLKSAHVSLVSIVLDVNVSEIYMSRYAKEHFSYKIKKTKINATVTKLNIIHAIWHLMKQQQK